MAKEIGITINTDASFHPDHKVAGFAFWIKSDNFKLIGHGPLKSKPENAIHAKIMCIGNALGGLLFEKNIPIPRVDYLIINTDCQEGVKHILGKSGRFDSDKVNRLLEKVKVKTGINRFEFRHVKAHTDTNSRRTFVNHWCDTKAKEEMKKQLRS